MTIQEIKDLQTSIAESQLKYTSALRRKSGIATAKDSVKNVLFNNAESIIECLGEVAKLREENECLQTALDDADAELNRLKKSSKARKEDTKNGEKE